MVLINQYGFLSLEMKGLDIDGIPLSILYIHIPLTTFHSHVPFSLDYHESF